MHFLIVIPVPYETVSFHTESPSLGMPSTRGWRNGAVGLPLLEPVYLHCVYLHYIVFIRIILCLFALHCVYSHARPQLLQAIRVFVVVS